MKKFLILPLMLLWLAGCQPLPTSTASPTLSPTNTSTATEVFQSVDEPPAFTATYGIPPSVLNVSQTPTPSSATFQVTFEIVTQIGGGLTSMALVDEVIFAGQGARLIALDVSNAVSPQKVGQSDLLPSLVENLIVSKETAYIIAGNTLIWLDVSNPAQMVNRGQIELPAPGRIILRDETIYAGGRTAIHYNSSGSLQGFESYIATIDVSVDPELLDIVTIPHDITALALAGDWLFVGHERGISRMDISDPAEMTEPDPVTIPYQELRPRSMRVYGNTLIVGGSYQLAALDITNVRAPRPLWREQEGEFGNVYDFAVHENKIYTVGSQSTEGFIPATATVEMTETLPQPDYYSATGTLGIIAAEQRFYLIDQRTLSIQNIRDGVQQMGSFTTLTGGDIALDQDILYSVYRGIRLLSGAEQRAIASFELPNLTPLSRYDFQVEDAQAAEGLSGITLQGDYLYLIGDNQMRILNAKNFALLSTIQSEDNEILLFQQVSRDVSIPVIDGIAYLYALHPEQSTEEIIRFDVSNPANPVELDRTPIEPHLHIAAIAATEQWLVVSLRNSFEGGQDFLTLYDLTGERPTLIAELEIVYAPTELQISDNILLAGTGDLFDDTNSVLELYSLPNLARLGQEDFPNIHEIRVLDKFVLVTMKQDSRLLVLDINDPANPQLVGTFNLPADEGEIAVSDRFIVVGNEEMGLFVLQINQ